MKKILTFIFTTAIFQGYAQFTYDYLRAADQYFGKGDYYSAAQYYEKYLGLGGGKVKKNAPSYTPYTVQTKSQKGGGTSAAVSSRQQAVYNLAEAYRLLHYPEKAAPNYKETMSFDKSHFPLARWHYGKLLREMHQPEEAAAVLNEFLADYTNDDAYAAAARLELKNIAFAQAQLQKKDLSLYKVNKLDATLNPGGANYAPVWLDGQTFLFTSTRSDSTVASKNKNDNRIYKASYANGSALSLQKINLGQTSDIQQGVSAVSPDGNRLYVTRWSSANGRKTSALYVSKKEAGEWSIPVKAGGLNTDSSSSQQPFAMPDGKRLLFASNRPGGSGGFDLYEAQLDGDGMATAVTNLGPTINTTGDEQAPFFHAASSTLVFSANSRTGMGGYDFYYSMWGNGVYAEPVNFGHPVNSVKDDLYFSSRGSARNILEDVLLSSDRSAACCLELFALSKDKPLKQISGVVIRCDNNNPMTDVTVKIMDTIRNVVVSTHTTAMDGSYSFTLEDFQPLKAVASSDGYYDNALTFFAPADENLHVLRNDNLCLEKKFPPAVGVVEELENIYYEFDEYNLLPASFPTLDKLANNLKENPNVVIELAGHTDSKGGEVYNQQLSQKRAQSCVSYLISKGVSARQLVAKGYGKTVPVAENTNADGSDNTEGRAKNRRTEFKVLEK